MDRLPSWKQQNSIGRTQYNAADKYLPYKLNRPPSWKQQNSIGRTPYNAADFDRLMTTPTWEMINMKTRNPSSQEEYDRYMELLIWGLDYQANPTEWQQIDAWYREHKGFSVLNIPGCVREAQDDLLQSDLTALQRRSQRKLVRFYIASAIGLRDYYYHYYTKEFREWTKDFIARGD